MARILPYQYEPEYSSGEEFEFESENDTEPTEESVSIDGTIRAGNTTWCCCGWCNVMPTEKESVCCQELRILSNLTEDLPCITSHESFLPVCLNRDVLWTALVSLHDRENAGLPNRDEAPNRSLRYAAYRQFTWWVHGYLGKKIHRVIPSCAVTKIRERYPEPSGVYIGYKAGDDDDDSDFDEDIALAWRDFQNL
ncbi:hypothetical protein QZH41_011474 [Actinostola sp. cb2023]|nr:hypothetical protein QZH41_011474 [Actinostola sp. cb2023]